MAVGATTGHVLALITARMLLWVGAGSAAGLVAALWLAQFLEPLLYGVKARDATQFAAVLIVLSAVSLAAVLQPSLRAIRIDPARTLRHE
jgi:ABC-type antimicrobial peptide transport system permease subunit